MRSSITCLFMVIRVAPQAKESVAKLWVFAANNKDFLRKKKFFGRKFGGMDFFP